MDRISVELWKALGSKIRSRRRVADPLGVEVERWISKQWDVLLPGELPDTSSLPLPNPSNDVVYAWLDAHGSYDLRRTVLLLKLEGLVDRAVRVVDIEMNVDRRLQPFETYVSSQPAGAFEWTLLHFDLDETDPEAWEAIDEFGVSRVGDSPYFRNHTISLAKGEVCDLTVFVDTDEWACDWTLDLKLEVAGRSVKHRVDWAGRPFRTAGVDLTQVPTHLDWAWWEGRFQPMADYSDIETPEGHIDEA